MAAISIRDWRKPGEPGSDLDRLFGPLYRHLLDEQPLPTLLEELCQALSDELQAVLVAVATKLDGGTIGLEAAAPNNGVWAAFKSLPERFDGTLTGQGPAALALESGAPAWQSTSEEGLLPWRESLSKEHVAAVGAWPLHQGDRTWVLEVFSSDDALFRNGAAKRNIERIVRELGRFLAHAANWRQQRLLAKALEHHGHAAFITNLHGEIEWSNRAFTKLYGYTADEARGKTPKLLHSGKQGLRYYRDLWGTIRSGRVWSGETIDRGKDDVNHTVRQTVTPFGLEDRVTNYLSTHEDITKLAAERNRKELMEASSSQDGDLMNSVRFDAAVDAAINDNTPFTLALLSLRGYRDLTADLTPELAEAVSAEFGSRLRDILGPGACAGISEPGEYRLLLSQVKVSNATLRRVIEALEAPFPLLGQSSTVRPRIALAAYPRDGRSRDELMRHADAELADQPTGRANRKLKN